MIRQLIEGDCLDTLGGMSECSVDLTVTSPPYDNLRTYKGSLQWHETTWKAALVELYRVTKEGGVVVWVVGDATVKGSETGSSFKQVLFAKSIGFNLYDTMIYKKLNRAPLSHRRYEQDFEYMFILSKGRPKVFNPIMIPCKYAGQKTFSNPSYYKTSNDDRTRRPQQVTKDNKIKGNIWEYRVGSLAKSSKFKHPAQFPEQLAMDHILSWSNEGDLILDPFMGAGTVPAVARRLKRDYIGIEKVHEYFQIAQERVEAVEVEAIDHDEELDVL